jgi:long-chain acyl-CoA synthetase
MGSLGFWRLARQDPDWIAAVDPDGTSLTAGELLARSNRIANGLRAIGLRPGDGIATLMPNGTGSLQLYLAAMQSGLYYTPINWHFTAPEAAHLMADSEAKAVFVHERYAETGLAAAVRAGLPPDRRFLAGGHAGYLGSAEPAGPDGSAAPAEPLDTLVAGRPDTPPEDRTQGAAMHYTSGTTGRPKGVRRPLTGLDPDDAGELLTALLSFFGMSADRPNAHLVTSPNYHTAVTQFGASALHLGHTLVCMDSWDAETALRMIERHRCTSTHMVPTHFKRLLALPEEVRRRYDVSSMRWAIHAAAPCPIPVKRAMLDWWGPCVYEYYAATEGGGTIASPQDWLAHPGTVGRAWPVSKVKVVDDDTGAECPAHTPGTVYMRMTGGEFAYKGDRAKTEEGRLGGYFTVGDIGYLDEDGFLYLCDRKSDVIISAGVNIYPAEIESELLGHPKVADAAVFGIPDEEWGEQVKAVIEPEAGVGAGPDLAAEILAALDGRLAKLKWPKTIDFIDAMPRDPSGKLLKRKLRAPYWEGREHAI